MTGGAILLGRTAQTHAALMKDKTDSKPKTLRHP
jgi:hypothetical protein